MEEGQTGLRPLLSGVRVSLRAYGGVCNVRSVREALMQFGKERQGQGQQVSMGPTAVLLNADLCASETHVRVAAQKAVFAQCAGRGKTRTLATELLYCVSASRSISEAIRTCGAAVDVQGDGDGEGPDLLLLLVEPESVDDEALQTSCAELREICDAIDGEFMPLAQVWERRIEKRERALRAAFKFTEAELQMYSVADAVITRLSTKDMEK